MARIRKKAKRRPAKRRVRGARRKVRKVSRKVKSKARKKAKRAARRKSRKAARRPKRKARKAKPKARKKARKAMPKAKSKVRKISRPRLVVRRGPVSRPVMRPLPIAAAAAKRVEVGKISHYYNHIGVAVIELSGDLNVGDNILIESATRSFKQKVSSMQVEHDKVDSAHAGQSIGMKVDEPVRDNYRVYRLL